MLRTCHSKTIICIRVTALAFICLGFASFADAQTTTDGIKSVEQTGGYVRSQGNAKVIVFMHGLYSGPEAWKCDQSHYWPEMIAKDENPVLSKYDLYVAKYPTPSKGGTMTLSDLESNIYNQLRSDHIFDKHKEIVFVAHSMGGILTQQLLITFVNARISAKVTAIILYGTPQEGSRLANVGSVFSRDPLLRELQAGEGNFILHDMDQKWIHGPTKDIKRYCAYETKKESGFKVVDVNSATRGCNDYIAIDANHRDLVKPCSTKDSSYEFLSNTLGDIQEPVLQSESAALASGSPAARASSTPYDQAGGILDSLAIIIGQYDAAAGEIRQEFASPYKRGQPGPMPKALPDEFFQRTVDIDHRSSESYRELRFRILNLRERAEKCFQLTPNQLRQDRSSFDAADVAALTSIPLEQLRLILGANPTRFFTIRDYVETIRKNLADARCEMY